MSNNFCYEGDSTATDNTFFETSFTFSDNLIEVTCCADDSDANTKVNCGRGVSCEGQCAAKRATLCPTGNCTGDPKDCKLTVLPEDGESSGPGEERSGATLFGAELNWCPKDGCPVTRHHLCCFHPICYNKQREECCWLDYYAGGLLVFGPKSHHIA